MYIYIIYIYIYIIKSLWVLCLGGERRIQSGQIFTPDNFKEATLLPRSFGILLSLSKVVVYGERMVEIYLSTILKVLI